jgi:hypothetical protein
MPGRVPCRGAHCYSIKKIPFETTRAKTKLFSLFLSRKQTERKRSKKDMMLPLATFGKKQHNTNIFHVLS